MDDKNPSIIAWNIHGGVDARRKRKVKDIIMTFQPSIFAVVETHYRFDIVISFWR